MVKEKRKDRSYELSLDNLILLLLGITFLVVGVRHYDFFGLNWKNIICMFLGLAYLLILAINNKNGKRRKTIKIKR